MMMMLRFYIMLYTKTQILEETPFAKNTTRIQNTVQPDQFPPSSLHQKSKIKLFPMLIPIQLLCPRPRTVQFSSSKSPIRNNGVVMRSVRPDFLLSRIGIVGL